MNKKKLSRLAEKLTVLAYDFQEQLFFLDDQHLGFGFVCEPLSQADEGIAARLNVLLNLDWPQGSTLQFCLMANSNIQGAMLAYQTKRIKQKNPLFVISVKQRIDYLCQLSQVFSDKTSLACVRDFKLLITVKVPTGATFPTEHKIEEIHQLQITVLQALKTIGFNLSIMDATAYLSYMSDLINLQRPIRSPAVFDEDKPLNQQILDWDTSLEIDEKQLKIANKILKTLSFKRFPSRLYFGHASQYAGDKMTGTRGLQSPFYLTATLHFMDLQSQLARLETKRQWSINQAYGSMLKFVPVLAEKKHGFDVLFESIEKGDRPVQLMMTLVLISNNESSALSDVSNAKTFYKELGFEIMEDKFFNFPIWLNSLPFGAEVQAIKDLFRYKTLTSSQAAVLLPLFCDWKGTGTPIITLISRSGQLMPVSLFDSGSNFNCCIAAQSGAGKSFLVNEMITSYLSAGGQCWVIDVGRSYEKVCEFFQGDFLSFGQDSHLSFNPFALVEQYEEEADMLVALICAMAAPNSPLSDFQQAELKKQIHQLWHSKHRQTSIDDLATQLLNHDDSRIKDMGTQLYPFTQQGEYGRFFKTGKSIKLNGHLTVLELEELKGRKNLQQVILLILIYQIQQEMYLGIRDKPKIIFIDEAWDLLTQGDVAKFIETGYRRFRKYGGSAVTITQSINDLYQSPTGKAIAENSANLYLLGQKTETINQLKQSGRLPLSEAGYELLKTVHTVPGSYAEIFLLTERGAGIGRLRVDPYHQLLYSTRADDIYAIKSLTEQGISTHEAILYLVSLQHPSSE